MKRKDTKVYADIVENYCSTRHYVEYKKKEISNSYEGIGRAKATYDTIVNKNNAEIRMWYNTYVDILRMNAGMSENIIEEKTEKIKELEHILKEDLDKLYDEWLIKEHLKK